MSKKPAPNWLTSSFFEGVVFTKPVEDGGVPRECWLGLVDEECNECAGHTQGCHFIKRQRVEEVLDRQLVACAACVDGKIFSGGWGGGGVFVACSVCDGIGISPALKAELILLAAYDPRNGVPGCSEQHHPRFDSKQTPPLVVHIDEVPASVLDFVADYGLETALEDKTRR